MGEQSPHYRSLSELRSILRASHSWLALAYGAPSGLIGELIGLGGAEFRLPVLGGPLRYSAHRGVPLNLAVSLVTLGAALPVRTSTLALNTLTAALPVVVALIAGALIGAFVGLGRLSAPKLECVLLTLLVTIGGAPILEGFLPQEPVGLVPDASSWRALADVAFGLGIGLVSSLLGVAGGEIITPTLVLGFGLAIKAAGSASPASSMKARASSGSSSVSSYSKRAAIAVAFVRRWRV